MTLDSIQNIKIESFDYPLPDERIARHPLDVRDACRLIVSDSDGNIGHHVFSELPALMDRLLPGALLVCNETKVINARMEFFKSTGSRIEIFLLEPYDPADYVLAFSASPGCVWNCMVGNLKKWKGGTLSKQLDIPATGLVTLSAELADTTGETPRGGAHRVRFSWDNPSVSFAEIVEAAGNIPIPPYLKRDSESRDALDYQTVYSRVKGSVAAPTAGLHFTDDLFRQLGARGVDVRKVILHVGAGTFQPVKSENIGGHPMHSEKVAVEIGVIEDLIKALRGGRPVAAVGTTSVRTLESLPGFGFLSMSRDVANPDEMHLDQWEAYGDEMSEHDTIGLLETLHANMKRGNIDTLVASTSIMIAPGFRWRIVDGLVTNFHQPQSTLLLLVSSLLEQNRLPGDSPQWRKVYDEALDGGYRFLSYGDASLLIPLKK